MTNHTDRINDKPGATADNNDDMATVAMHPVAHTEIPARVVTAEEKERNRLSLALLKEFRL